MKASIFVNIASYRDSECAHTIKSLFHQASDKYVINVGVGWQLAPEDSYMVPQNLHQYSVKNIFVPSNESEGCCWMRSRINKELYNGETYFLNIDSHTRFIADWDDVLVSMIKQYPTKTIISTYPNAYEPPDIIITDYPHGIQAHGVNHTGLPLLSPSGVEEGPRKGLFVAGGFMFGRGIALREVPYDPYLFFFGEEISMAARYYTHGYNIIEPGKVILYHYYTREKSPKHWFDNAGYHERNNRAIKRVKHLLKLELCQDQEALKDLHEYGLGNVRTIESYKDEIKFYSLELKE